MNADYATFVERKLKIPAPEGIRATIDIPSLMPWQTRLTEWALRRGRAALFEDTGLGKTRQQLVWADTIADHTDSRVLILAPLGVVQQTAAEAQHVGIDATPSRDGTAHRITIANYERLHRFDPTAFQGIVLDESSRIKNFDSRTRTEVIEAFSGTPYRLACTATPAPNDHMELGNHAEFLGVMTRAEMLAMYFVHDGARTSQWRLKGHAKRDFWRWVASWAVAIRHPNDIGYQADGYDLPELHTVEHVIPGSYENGTLFGVAAGLSEQREARRANLDDRVRQAADIINAEPSESWVAWCELNDESAALANAIPGAVELTGSDTLDEKEDKLAAFTNGDARVLVTKPSIAAHGLNWQHCARTLFCGIGHSYEQYYQAVRRFHRYGQTRSVHVHLVYGESDIAIRENLRRKETEAAEMTDSMIALMAPHQTKPAEQHHNAVTRPMEIPAWLA